MPNTQNKPEIDPRRFASVLAGFDTSNDSDAEAATKGLALRRMATKAGMRIVDLMELPEVRQAIDDQMRPIRKETPELRSAVNQALALQAELTERTRDIRQLADLLRQQKERTEALNQELRAARTNASQASRAQSVSPVAPQPARSPSFVAAPNASSRPSSIDWSMFSLPKLKPSVLGLVVIALIPLFCAIVSIIHHAGGNHNGLDNGQRISPPGIHEDGKVRAVPKHRALHHGVPRGPASHRAR